MAQSRGEKILSAVAKFPEHAALALRAVEDGTSYSDFQKEFLTALAGPLATGGLEVGERLSHSPAWRRAITDYLVMAGNNGRLLAPEDKRARREAAAIEAGRLCGPGKNALREVAEKCLRLPRDERGNTDFYARSFSMSASDLPVILKDAANVMLQESFAAQPKNWLALGRVRDIPNFLPVTSAKLGVVNLQVTPELVPVAHAAPPDSGGTYSIQTWAAEIGVGRQAFTNDGLSALVGAAAQFGEAANRLIGDTVFNLICSNTLAGPVQAEDGQAFFSASHVSGSNLQTGAATPDTTGCGVLLKLMRAQTGFARTGDTKPKMNIRAKYLLCPGALEGIGRATVAAFGNPELEDNENPAVVRGLHLLVEPRLDSFSATGFYVVSDSVPGLELGFLNGRTAPTIAQTRSDPMGWRAACVLDFGCALVEHRGWARHAGV